MKIKTKALFIFVILVTLAGIGCTSSPNDNNTVSDINESSSESPDATWLKSAIYWLPVITDDLKPIVAAVDAGNISDVNSSKLMSDTQAAIEESDQYEVSSNLQFAKIEYDLSMKAFNGAAQVIALEDMENTTKYLTEGFTHIQRYNEHINSFNEQMKN
ncbi:hypothetical protein [Methanosarcina barkeri]|uniref:hypothetical protein n=1 Tax=Methanosarcina barkeri TaxID=2208 RepID=UPI000053E511|nr:hypothetical protein [Methanosarcina barkeri]